MSQKNVVYVDLNDKVVGSGTIKNAYEKGAVVRIVRVFILNNKNALLLQKRLGGRFSSAKWDQSAGGHVDEGETNLVAAKRELLEEMSIKKVKLNKVSKFYTEDQPHEHVRKRYNTIYYGTYTGEVVIDTQEVADYLWISLPKLNQWIEKSPEDFTNGFLDSYKILLDSSNFEIT